MSSSKASQGLHTAQREDDSPPSHTHTHTMGCNYTIKTDRCLRFFNLKKLEEINSFIATSPENTEGSLKRLLGDFQKKLLETGNLVKGRANLNAAKQERQLEPWYSSQYDHQSEHLSFIAKGAANQAPPELLSTQC